MSILLLGTLLLQGLGFLLYTAAAAGIQQHPEQPVHPEKGPCPHMPDAEGRIGPVVRLPGKEPMPKVSFFVRSGRIHVHLLHPGGSHVLPPVLPGAVGAGGDVVGKLPGFLLCQGTLGCIQKRQAQTPAFRFKIRQSQKLQLPAVYPREIIKSRTCC